MKKIFIALLLICSSFFLFAQEAETSDTKNDSVTVSTPLWFDVAFSEGVSFNQLTRIEKLTDRSNFVRENFMAGAFFSVQTVDFWKLDFILQLGAYYPFYNAFNGMAQKTRNMFNYAFDMYFGALYSNTHIKFLLIDISLGLHYMYQLTDEYHMNYVGLGTLDTIRLPLSSRWTLVNNYFFSFDNPNLGTNKNIQPFTASYQYHIDLGIRYSRRVFNDYSYISKNTEE